MSEENVSGEVTKDEKTMALLAHLSTIVIGFIGPLVLWLIKKDESEFIADQSKEALNFQITCLIGYVISMVLTIVIIGMILFPLIWLASLILSIMGGVAANKGERYRYPFAIRLIK